MSRWVWLLICAILGLVMLVCGLQVPVHLRALDVSVVEQAGRKGQHLSETGLELLKGNHLGSAAMLSAAAEQGRISGRERLAVAIAEVARQHPEFIPWGGSGPNLSLEPWIAGPAASANSARSSGSLTLAQSVVAGLPITDVVVPEENRTKSLEALRRSPLISVQELLHTRTLTNTVLFPSAQSASGQAFDSAVALTGLLLSGGHFSPAMSNAVFGLAFDANHSGDSQRLEQTLMDILALGQRLSWDQLVTFAGRVRDPETLRVLTGIVRSAGTRLPVVFSAVQMASDPAAVTAYLTEFSQSGLEDVGSALEYGTGGLNELLSRKQRLHVSGLPGLPGTRTLAEAFSGLAWQSPLAAMALKWFFYLGAGFLFAAAGHFFVQYRVERAVRSNGGPGAEQVVAYRSTGAYRAYATGKRPAGLPLRSGGLFPNFHVAREVLFSLGFLLVILLLSEPFLSQESQKTNIPFRLRLPTVGSVIPSANPQIHTKFMNQLSLLTLLLFFVLQALIYTACLVKLAEIRRQQLPPRIKLRLLENEDHLFDAGLYLGFVGTIISLILVSLGVIKPSLMAAYSSTSFGIIFVSVFKIFNLRPVRRKLLLEAEASVEPATSGPAPRLATPS